MDKEGLTFISCWIVGTAHFETGWICLEGFLREDCTLKEEIEWVAVSLTTFLSAKCKLVPKEKQQLAFKIITSSDRR